MAQHRILITGAAGNLGRVLRERPARRLSCPAPVDREEMAPAGPGEEIVRCDLTDATATARLCEGVDAILHFGGRSLEGSWPEVLGPNIVGAINLWEGARLAGVERIVFASSNHVVGLYRRTEKLDHHVTPRPDGRYGLSKAFGEDLASLYAYKHGIKAFCMRIGSCFGNPTNQRMLSTWLSYPDFEQLVRVGLSADYLFEVVYGHRATPAPSGTTATPIRLGYDRRTTRGLRRRGRGKVSGNPVSDQLQAAISCRRISPAI
jgi:uronate dehydrogenase